MTPFGRVSPSFNEAGARTPQKAREARRPLRCGGRFNEARARTPQKVRKANTTPAARARLQ